MYYSNKAEKYLYDILTNRFKITDDLYGKTIKSTIIGKDFVVILTTDNHIFQVFKGNEYDDIVESVPHELWTPQVAFSQLLSYIQSSSMVRDVLEFITIEEFNMMNGLIQEDNQQTYLKTREQEIEKAKQLLKKYPELLNQK